MTAPDLAHEIVRILRRSLYPSDPRRVAALTGADPETVAATLADLVERGDVREVPGRRGVRFAVVTKSTPEPRRLTDGERIAAGLGTTWAPLPMGPLPSPMRRRAA